MRPSCTTDTTNRPSRVYISPRESPRAPAATVDAPSRERVKRDPRQQLWFKTTGPLPDDPLLHACVAAYASDMSVLDTALLPHGISWDDPNFMGASLDHAMWFHGPFRADDWLLYDQRPISTGGARGLAGGNIFTADGALAITVVQEGLVRVPHA